MTEETTRTGEVTQLRRIADALNEILRMVKADQERSRKYMEEQKSEQAFRSTNGPGLPGPCAMAGGARTMLQGSSSKLQAPGCKLDKTELQGYSIL